MNKKMKAAVFEGVGNLKIKEVDVSVVENPDELILEVEVCSICGTDVHIMKVPPGYEAKPGTILGHELVGKVVEKGEGVKTLEIGDRVVTNPDLYCGICRYCRKKLPNECENIIPMGIEADGGFAEYVKITEKVAHKINENLPAEIAAFAEPLACALNGMNKIKVEFGESALIIGAGPIGLLFTQLLKAAGVNPVIVSEPTELRQEYARKCGADYVVNPFQTNLGKYVKDIIDIGVDVAVDAVGSQLNECIKTARKGGRILLFGINMQAESVIKQSEITTKEIRILGTWLANDNFPRAVEILESNILNLELLITHKLGLDEIHKGIKLLDKGEGIKILVYPKR